MFGIGFMEVVMICVVALIAVGPKRLPTIAKALGRGYVEFRTALDDMKKTVYSDVTKPFEDGVTDFKKSVNDISKSVYAEAAKPVEEATDAFKNVYLDNILAEREKEKSVQSEAGPPPEISAEPKPVEAPVAAEAEKSEKSDKPDPAKAGV